jgi:hypothetical protein
LEGYVFGGRISHGGGVVRTGVVRSIAMRGLCRWGRKS